MIESPVKICTGAEVELESRDGGFAITTIHLDTEVEAEGVDDESFQEIAEATESSCPVSKALAAVETIELSARLAG